MNHKSIEGTEATQQMRRLENCFLFFTAFARRQAEEGASLEEAIRTFCHIVNAEIQELDAEIRDLKGELGRARLEVSDIRDELRALEAEHSDSPTLPAILRRDRPLPGRGESDPLRN